MNITLSQSNIKRVYPQFIAKYQERLTYLKKTSRELYATATVQQSREHYRFLFETTLDREAELKNIKLAFEKMKKSLPDTYEKDRYLIQISEELESYLRGINQLIRILRKVRTAFYNCHCLIRK
ncbi:hypothetical protein P7H71_03025 [Lactococcus lactis]|uniref:Uncharacterized protein n=1 Tax=Lactococcus lactis TaxID=1358 RepID=A0AAP5UCS6_9LACT|nr:hypothetical protein [Lactococcus lactis]MDT2858524.1 hypothetical protein [Lactococcus lactis]MDT2866656.1 hypothetical protein [Lactococcus lactis]MDT2872659.1 hypothetical protein [Lactococcus lactis]MDT2877566.1 hypothetical protein [Lactococcus lactis]MDT2880068.1 hypothetical protein [Lactococcus lactis]